MAGRSSQPRQVAILRHLLLFLLIISSVPYNAASRNEGGDSQSGRRQTQRAVSLRRLFLLFSAMISSDPGVATAWGKYPHEDLHLSGSARMREPLPKTSVMPPSNVPTKLFDRAYDAVYMYVYNIVSSSLFSKSVFRRHFADKIVQWYLRTYGTWDTKVKYALACSARVLADRLEAPDTDAVLVYGGTVNHKALKMRNRKREDGDRKHEAFSQGLLELPSNTQEHSDLGLHLPNNIREVEEEWLAEDMARRVCEKLEALTGYRDEQDDDDSAREEDEARQVSHAVTEQAKALNSLLAEERREAAKKAQQAEQELYLLALRTALVTLAAEGLCTLEAATESRDNRKYLLDPVVLLNQLKSNEPPNLDDFNLARVKFKSSVDQIDVDWMDAGALAELLACQLGVPSSATSRQ